jgi:hypothetical protein
MKRDMELVLLILQQLEERDSGSVIEKMQIDGYDDRVVSYHLSRMYEACLIDAETITSTTTPERLIRVLPFGLSWSGHEFLDSLRNKSVLNKVKTRIGNSLSDVPFTLIKELALAIGRDQLGL